MSLRRGVCYGRGASHPCCRTSRRRKESPRCTVDASQPSWETWSKKALTLPWGARSTKEIPKPNQFFRATPQRTRIWQRVASCHKITTKKTSLKLCRHFLIWKSSLFFQIQRQRTVKISRKLKERETVAQLLSTIFSYQDRIWSIRSSEKTTKIIRIQWKTSNKHKAMVRCSTHPLTRIRQWLRMSHQTRL